MAQTRLPGAPAFASGRPPLRVSVFVFFCLLDIGVAVIAVAAALMGWDLSQGTARIFGSEYSLDPPAFPWIVGPLAALSLAAAWFCVFGRHFAFVAAVALAWVALGLGAIATGSGEGLLLQRAFMAALVLSARSWFVS